jgi:hypothetical protein
MTSHKLGVGELWKHQVVPESQLGSNLPPPELSLGNFDHKNELPDNSTNTWFNQRSPAQSHCREPLWSDTPEYKSLVIKI